MNQAVGAFKAHLPESSPVNLVTEKGKAGRVYVCTYPTMMGLIDETMGTEARFGVGHFDLVIIMAVREGAGDYLPKMTGVQYEKKVQEYLKNHLDHIVIRRLRTNQPLTATDLRGLEQTLVEIGEDDGETLLTGLLARSDAPSLAHFVRSMVGMDRAAAQEVFSGFLSTEA